MRGHYRGDGGISFNVTGIARQSLEEQEPSPLKLANGAWGDVHECLKQLKPAMASQRASSS